MDNLPSQAKAEFVSPYLREPLRSLKEVLRAREARRIEAAESPQQAVPEPDGA